MTVAQNKEGNLKDNKSPFTPKMLYSPPMSPSSGSLPTLDDQIIEEDEAFLQTNSLLKKALDTKNNTFYTEHDHGEESDI